MNNMKTLFLIVYNYMRFKIKSLIYKKLDICGTQMIGKNTKFVIKRNSRVHIGNHCVTDGRFTVIVDENANLSIGDHVYFNENCMISCKGVISIGKGCKFGPNVKIFDNNHKFDKVNGVSNNHTYGNIEIGENCWIGSNVVILKGIKIGKNSVIGAGCVVSEDIPESSIVKQERKLIIERMR